MIRIEMNSNTRNYLIRLLENYKNNLKYSNLTERHMRHELEMIKSANDSLMGKKEAIALNKNIGLVNYGLGDDE